MIMDLSMSPYDEYKSKAEDYIYRIRYGISYCMRLLPQGYLPTVLMSVDVFETILGFYPNFVILHSSECKTIFGCYIESVIGRNKLFVGFDLSCDERRKENDDI